MDWSINAGHGVNIKPVFTTCGADSEMHLAISIALDVPVRVVAGLEVQTTALDVLGCAGFHVRSWIEVVGLLLGWMENHAVDWAGWTVHASLRDVHALLPVNQQVVQSVWIQ